MNKLAKLSIFGITIASFLVANIAYAATPHKLLQLKRLHNHVKQKNQTTESNQPKGGDFNGGTN